VSGPDKFEYTGDKKPASGKNLRTVPFYECTLDKGENAYVYNIDTLIQPPKPEPKPAPKPAPKPTAKPTQQSATSKMQATIKLNPDEVLIGGRMGTKITYTVNKTCYINIYYETISRPVRGLSLLYRQHNIRPHLLWRNKSRLDGAQH
jgi:hypothetical protein